MIHHRHSEVLGLVSLLALVGLVAGCSLLVDLPANCEPADCAGYACNADKTECLFQCRSDDQCAENYVCNVFSGPGSCVETGCRVEGEWSPLLPDVSRSPNIGYANNGSNVGVAYVNNVGLYFQLMDSTGTALGSPALLEDLSLTPAEPAVAWSPAGWAVVWDSITVVNSKNRETLRFAALSPEGVLTTAAKSLWVNQTAGDRNEKTVDSASLAFDAANQIFAVAWSTKVAVGSDVFLLQVKPDGSPLSGQTAIDHDLDVFRISNTAIDSVEPLVAVAQRGGPPQYDVVFREGDALLLRTVDANGDVAGSDVDLGMVAAGSRVTRHGYAPLTSGAATAFSVEGESAGIYRVQLDASRAILGGARFEVGDGAVEPDDANVASLAQGEYAVVFIADNMGARGVLFVQYKDSGAVVGFPRRLTDAAVDPSRPQVIPTDLGYVVFYQENDGPDAGKVMSAFVSCALASAQ
jgi:hypothetical protein